MARFDPFKARLAVSKLNAIRVWPYGIHGFIKKLRVLLKQFMATQMVEHAMILAVVGNTIVMCLDFYGAPDYIVNFCENANTFFTIVFTIEMGLRIMAIGPRKYS